MRFLCDSNVFLALVASGHPRHVTAREWFDALQQGDTAAFCRATQNSLLRLLSTNEIMQSYTLTNAQAVALYRRLSTDERIEFCTEPDGLEDEWLRRAALPRKSPKYWMDAYLTSFAILASRTLVTFDKAFRLHTGLDALVLGD